MATTPGSRRRSDITGDDRDPFTPMQEPLVSMDNPGSRTSNINEVNLPPGETVRRTGTLGTANQPASTVRDSRSFGTTFAIAAAVLIVAFLVAMSFGNHRSDVATTNGAQSPIADTTNGGANDTTGSTTAPSQQTAPGTGDAGGNTGAGTTTPPTNP